MKTLGFDYSLASIDFRVMAGYQSRVGEIHRIFHDGPRTDSGFGWLDYPLSYPREEFDKIIRLAGEIRNSSQAFIVIGIGGSYLGARAAIEMLGHSFHNLLPEEKRSGPQIYFAGNNVSGKYYTDLLEIIRDKDISLCMISKSGDTTEPAIAFRLLRSHLEKKYGQEEAKSRIYIITDQKKGPLRKLATDKGYQAFAIPQDIGGRYSVLTPVGMLPMAVAGIDILKVMEGATDACNRYNCEELADNPCYQYGVARNILQDRGMEIELLAYYEPSLYFFAQWWRQLFAESEGKEGKGLFTGAVEFVSELHSLGQLLQEGKRNIFETVLNIEKENLDLEIIRDPDNLDGLDYLSGKKMGWITKKGMEGTALAHTDGGVPNLLVSIPEISEYYFGQLVYFFKKACAMSCYLSGVNPFDQPGVEGYKGNMYALLGKPGYQEQRDILRKRLEKNAQQRKL